MFSPRTCIGHMVSMVHVEFIAYSTAPDADESAAGAWECYDFPVDKDTATNKKSIASLYFDTQGTVLYTVKPAKPHEPPKKKRDQLIDSCASRSVADQQGIIEGQQQQQQQGQLLHQGSAESDSAAGLNPQQPAALVSPTTSSGVLPHWALPPDQQQAMLADGLSNYLWSQWPWLIGRRHEVAQLRGVQLASLVMQWAAAAGFNGPATVPAMWQHQQPTIGMGAAAGTVPMMAPAGSAPPMPMPGMMGLFAGQASGLTDATGPNPSALVGAGASAAAGAAMAAAAQWLPSGVPGAVSAAGAASGAAEVPGGGGAPVPLLGPDLEEDSMDYESLLRRLLEDDGGCFSVKPPIAATLCICVC